MQAALTAVPPPPLARSPRELPIRTQIVRAALAAIRMRGADPRPLIARYSLPETADRDPEVTLPLGSLHALLEDAERLTADPFLGLHMAMHFPRGTYGVVEFIARNSPTIGDGLRRIVQYACLVTNRVQVTLEQRGEVAIIEHQIPGEPLATGRHSNEFFLCSLVLQGREQAGAPFVPNRVWFAHPAPADASELVAHLGTSDIRFGGGVNRLELPSELLALPTRTHDPALLSVLDREVQQALGQTAAPAFLDRVREAIAHQLGTGAPTLHGVARALGTSDRTLQRRLLEERCSFRDVVDTVRAELATKYLADPEKGLSEIAFRLGYAELSAFLRAFKRWTGTTPTRVRDASTRT